jgi:hypothetical protein
MARQSQINQPSQEDLLRALMAGQEPVDTSAAVKGVIQGEDLSSTILKNKQAQEDRVRTLAEKIKQAKMQKDFSKQVGAGDSALTSALNLDPAQGTRQFLEQKFTERAAKAPKAPSYSKIGETDNEIILADLADPNKQFRVAAPGVGKKGGKDDAAKNKLTLDIEKERANVIINKAKKALTQTGPWTTGAGSLLGKLPGTPARNLRGTVDTIKANLGFEQLAKMRAASPTGGALGQIAVKELEFLQAAVANLDPDQHETQVEENLKEVITRYENWLKAVEQAGGEMPGTGTPPPAAGNPGGSGLSPEQRRARIAELKAKQANGTLR